ncbi:MAG: FTR1 family protein [Sphingomonas bacterium]|nr:FTR1 family protein [Sphingomonas bacterium]
MNTIVRQILGRCAARRNLILALAQALLLILAVPAYAAPAHSGDVQTAWRLIDYLAVDYAGAVQNGKVKSPAEYAEMVEFSTLVRSRIGQLPKAPRRKALIDKAEQLKLDIAEKKSPVMVAALAHELAADLLATYPVPLAPTSPPDLARGASLYQENCASCHGASGDGVGPAAAGLKPRPIAFVDAERARERSLFALYQVIGQGLDGTAMRAFSEFSAQDRWALAFSVGGFAFSEEVAIKGERLWSSDPAIRKLVPDMVTLAGLTPAALSAKVGPANADALTAFLRRNPDAVLKTDAGALTVTRTKLAESLRAYEAGDRISAEKLALSAYLDGFEPVEAVLSARDAALMARIEGAMGKLRSAIDKGRPVSEVRERVEALDSLFADAETALSPDRASDASTFVGAFAILLREGLEALLIVVAMIAFLRKAKREDALVYVHGGWIAALAGGAASWAVATYAIGISGASRELTEGFGSLFAAVMLLSVGIWMHGKSQAGQWQKYIREKLSAALSRRSAWFLFGLAFLVVYREVFETILFYIALWTEGNGGLILGGAAAGTAVLAIIAWFMLRYSQKLPFGQFFAYSSVLVAILTLVLAGKGIAGLQEAGLVNVMPVANFPRISMLGIFPTVETITAQLLALAAVIAGYLYNRRRAANYEKGGGYGIED